MESNDKNAPAPVMPQAWADRMPRAWVDLIEGLTLLATRQNNDLSPFNCEHDTLTVMANPADFTPEELAHLDERGFFPSEDGETFTSFRFGNA